MPRAFIMSFTVPANCSERLGRRYTAYDWIPMNAQATSGTLPVVEHKGYFIWSQV